MLIKNRFKVLLIMLLIPNILLANIKYEGSSTISTGFLEELVKSFKLKTGIDFSYIGNKGSGEGFKAVMSGQVDIGGLSRPLNNKEKEKKFFYQVVGYDAIVVYINSKNKINTLSREQVKGIFTGKIKNWKEVGGENAPIEVITEIIGGGRATLIEFQHLALDGEKFGKVKEIDKPLDCVKAVSNNINAITYATISFKLDGVKVLAYDNIEPSKENILSGAYALSRPLILVSRELPKGKIEKFYLYVLSEEGQKIISKNFVPVR